VSRAGTAVERIHDGTAPAGKANSSAMPLNIHPNTKVRIFEHPFYFDLPYMGKRETIPILEVGYEDWGDPRNPAILVCHALSQNTHATDADDPDDLK